MKNVILIGCKKCGKSTIGQLLAAKMQKTFIDSDLLIEDLYAKRYGARKTCAHICRDHQEKFFRLLEKEILFSLPLQGGIILATGGGTLLLEENARYLKQRGCLLFLDAPFSLLQERIAKEDSFLYAESSLLPLLHERREKILAWADHVIVTKEKSPDQIVEEILRGDYGK